MFLLHPGSKDDSTYIVQTLDFHLGHNTMVTKPCGALESPMATITKITRRRHENPPHGVATVKEWFSYVTAMRNEGQWFLPCDLPVVEHVLQMAAPLRSAASQSICALCFLYKYETSVASLESLSDQVLSLCQPGVTLSLFHTVITTKAAQSEHRNENCRLNGKQFLSKH